MSLVQYKQKRRFDKTPEPAGKARSSGRRLEFVVQKHNASHLHYDFRLEMDGVLKSWAIPKGPSLNPKDKRLAMMVEDHPWEYRKFEGVIPKGNYGAGKVIIWDRGWYELDRQADNWPKSLREGLKKGELKFVLHGQKLRGSFALIKTPRMGDNAWLLIKHKDKYATDEDVTKQSASVISGQDVDDVAGDSELKLDDYPKSKILRNVKPMLATLTKAPFDDPDWIFEIKWDGYRAIGSWDGKKIELYSRNGLDFSGRYAEVTKALKGLKHKVVLDGEIVALDESGRSHFEYLQNWGRQPKGSLAYAAFDLLWLDGHDLRDQPLIKRKELLQRIIAPDSPIFYSDHVTGAGKSFFKAAKAKNLEGIMAKQAQSIYRAGVRSESWLKVKTHQRQEVVIGGYTEPNGSRKYIGALLVGVYENNKLIYVGHVGGLPGSDLKSLLAKLKKLERSTPPFADADKIKPNAPVHWVSPKLVGEVSFSEWTADKRMRQPIFVGLRPDKPAKEVVKESPKPVKLKPAKTEPAAGQTTRLHFSHLDKIFFPAAKITKGQLIDYYQTVAPVMLPYLKDRPHSLLRHPNGVDGPAFFQKDVESAPDWIKTVSIYSESNDKDINYLVCDSIDSLLYMVQLGCIEINPWNSRLQRLDKPDWAVIDLDPDDISFNKVVKVAQTVHDLCDELGIPSYPKTSGKTGIHIYIPLQAKYDYDQVKAFAEILANIIQQWLPDFTSVLRPPAQRRKKIYIDYLQNRQGQTLAAPYSVRPTPHANVSTPLHWDEVSSSLKPTQFTIKNIPKRIDKFGDIWQPVLGRGIDLKKILSKLQ